MEGGGREEGREGQVGTNSMSSLCQPDTDIDTHAHTLTHTDTPCQGFSVSYLIEDCVKECQHLTEESDKRVTNVSTEKQTRGSQFWQWQIRIQLQVCVCESMECQLTGDKLDSCC